MENATKALIIVASLLIGMMVLSLAVYLTTTMGNSASQIHEQVRQNQLAEFNAQFTKLDGRTDVTIYDILTVANLAKDNNDDYGLDNTDPKNETSFYISVSANTNSGSVTDFSGFASDSTKMKKELITSGGANNLQTYTCKVSVSNVTGRVYKVVFNKN